MAALSDQSLGDKHKYIFQSWLFFREVSNTHPRLDEVMQEFGHFVIIAIELDGG